MDGRQLVLSKWVVVGGEMLRVVSIIPVCVFAFEIPRFITSTGKWVNILDKQWVGGL